jgi:hypothetical protein
MLWTPPGGKVGRIGEVVTVLSFLTSFVICRIWFKGTSTKALEEGGSIIFSFNFPFHLEAIFHLPPSTYVYTKLARVSMKKGSILSFKGISKMGVLSFG